MRSIAVFLLWLIGTVTAVGVAWSGVGVIDDELVNPAPAVLGATETILLDSEPLADSAGSGGGSALSTRSTVELDASADVSTGSGDDGDSSTAKSTSTSTSSTSTTATSTPDASTTSGSGRSTSTARSQSDSTSTAVSTNGSTTSTTQRTTSTSSPTTITPSTSSTTTSGQVQTKTFNLIGGVTAIAFSSSATEVLWATPNPGFEVRIEPEFPGIKVEFRAEHHRSRVDAWWSNGPRHEIREEPED